MNISSIPPSSPYGQLPQLPQLPEPPELRAGRLPDTEKKEIYVFDSFGGGEVYVGIGYTSHGDIVASIIEGKTGIKPVKVNVEDFNQAEKVLEVLNSLLARGTTLKGIFLNFSINADSDSRVKDAIFKAAELGAIVTIAAGNDDVNGLTEGLKEHKNIRIVAASNGVIGKSENGSRDPGNVYNSRSTDIANGRLKVGVINGGLDFTNDGKVDIPLQNLAPPPRNLSGSPLESMNKTNQIQPNQSNFLATIDGGVISGRTVNDKDALPDSVWEDLSQRSGLKKSELLNVWFDVDTLKLHIDSLGAYPPPRLYYVDENGKLQRVQMKSSLETYGASSWAAPNLLADFVNGRKKLPD